MVNSPGSRLNSIYLLGSDKLLTDMQPGSRVTRTFSGVEKPFLVSNLAFKAVTTEK